jgi:hypothetical protein
MNTLNEQVEKQTLISNINMMLEITKQPVVEFKKLYKKSIDQLREMQEDNIEKYNLFLKTK